MSRRVVISGVGPITAAGVGIDALWDLCVAGRSAISRIERFAEASMPCPFAAELDGEAFRVRDVVPKSYRKATKVMCRDIELAVAAAAAAVADAGLTTRGTDADAAPTVAPERMGCHIGAGLISADVDELSAALFTSQNSSPRRDDDGFDLRHWGEGGMNYLTPLWLLKYLPNMLACHVTIIHDCQGPSNTITCCEASSALSAGESMRVIQRDDADACLTGGAESKLNPMSYMRQHFAGRLADTAPNHDPTALVRPFDEQAAGTVIGEGGGILLLEERESARRRGARIYAEVGGFASRQSWCHDGPGLQPADDDEGPADAIEAALAEAGAEPGEVDAIVPLGASIRTSDAAEARAIRRVFGAAAERIPLVTTVPNVGNCNAGNGAVGLSVAARALVEQTLPARLNSRGGEGLDAAACDARPARLRTVLVFTTSQGGQNAAVVLRADNGRRGA